MTRKRTKSRQVTASPKRIRKFYIHIDRKPEVQAARLELPVYMHEQEIIEAVHDQDVILITGATGTGKTTQVPQFLVEDGFGHPSSPSSRGIIAVTQPRRVAAVSCAKRVAFEMNSSVGGTVGYQIRHESKFGSDTRIKFGTDGIFLREVEQDILLRKYSAVIIDEVHERSLNTDLLLSFLSRSIVLRREKKELYGPLKVIIMSATLDIDGIFAGDKALFRNPPVVKVPSRQHPITIHFAKRTVDDYVEEAYRKVANIHRRLPQGGILVFLSGREEVERVCARLRAEFTDQKIRIEGSDGVELRIDILPFYSLLPDHLQRRVFKDSAPEARKVVVATNIAETSVTVPGISYVVDSGRFKEKVYKGRGCARLSAYEVKWISRASAEQRAGRAGRIGSGHCYRLYSSAVYVQQFTSFQEPEITRVPADTVVLRLRSMGIRYVRKFPFATAPNAQDISDAEQLLTDLGALATSGCAAPLGVTRLGRELATLPVEPRLGRLLLSARVHENAIPFACRLGGVLSVGTTLRREVASARDFQVQLQNPYSELLTELAAVCAVEHTGSRGRPDSSLNTTAMRSLCTKLGLHTKCILEAIAIARQVARAVGLHAMSIPTGPPDARCVNALLCAVVAGFGDRIARRLSRDEAAAAGVIPKLMNRAFAVVGLQVPVFLEGGSSVRLTRDVTYICFSELVEVKVRPRKRGGDEQDDYLESDDDEEIVMDGRNQEGEHIRKEHEIKNRSEKAVKYDEHVQDAPKRIVMRRASTVDSRWIIEEAQGMCEWSLIRESEPEYNEEKECVAEQVTVRYKGSGWNLGRKWVTVDEAGAMVEGRTTAHYAAFAKALISGRVDKDLYMKQGEGKVDICRRRVEEILSKREIYSLSGLKKCLTNCSGELIRLVNMCCTTTKKLEVSNRWVKGLRKLCEKKCGELGINQLVPEYISSDGE